MAFRTICACGKQLAFEERHLGKEVRCPGCKQTFMARPPEAARRAPDEEAPAKKAGEDPKRPYRLADEEDAIRIPRRRGEEDEEPAVVRRRPDRREHDEPERPRRPRRAAPGGPTGPAGALGRLLWNGPAFGVGCVVVALSVGLLVHGSYERTLSRQASLVPQQLPLAQLIRNGYGDNAHVVITDYVPANNIVFTYRTSKYDAGQDPSGKSWETVYVPLLPLTPDLKRQLQGALQSGTPPPQLKPSSVQVILRCTRARDAQELAGILTPDRVEGTVVNSISSIDPKAETLLAQAYPGTDVKNCLLVEENRKPSGFRFATGEVVIGASLIGLVLATAVMGFALRPRD